MTKVAFISMNEVGLNKSIHVRRTLYIRTHKLTMTFIPHIMISSFSCFRHVNGNFIDSKCRFLVYVADPCISKFIYNLLAKLQFSIPEINQYKEKQVKLYLHACNHCFQNDSWVSFRHGEGAFANVPKKLFLLLRFVSANVGQRLIKSRAISITHHYVKNDNLVLNFLHGIIMGIYEGRK